VVSSFPSRLVLRKRWPRLLHSRQILYTDLD
jgi:hypothetical protein